MVYPAELKHGGDGVSLVAKLMPLDQDAQMRSEISVMQSCSHPHVMKARLCGLYTGYNPKAKKVERQQCLVMNKANCSFDKVFWNFRREDHHTVPPAEVVTRFALELACGLAYLHQMVIIHNDLKVGNILQAADGSVRITDFGGSTAVRHRGLDVETHEVEAGGTLQFMAPELYAPMRAILKAHGADIPAEWDVEDTIPALQKSGRKRDVWGYGVCVLTGIIYASAEGEFNLIPDMGLVIDMDKQNDHLPYPKQNVEDAKAFLPALTSAALKCLQLNPADRPDMKDLRVELERNVEVWNQAGLFKSRHPTAVKGGRGSRGSGQDATMLHTSSSAAASATADTVAMEPPAYAQMMSIPQRLPGVLSAAVSGLTAAFGSGSNSGGSAQTAAAQPPRVAAAAGVVMGAAAAVAAVGVAKQLSKRSGRPPASLPASPPAPNRKRPADAAADDGSRGQQQPLLTKRSATASPLAATPLGSHATRRDSVQPSATPQQLQLAPRALAAASPFSPLGEIDKMNSVAICKELTDVHNQADLVFAMKGSTRAQLVDVLQRVRNGESVEVGPQ